MNSKKYLMWVSDQPCIHCGIGPPVQAHHIKHMGGFSGVGMKAPDLLTMPLCVDCHAAMHAEPDRWAYQPIYVLRTLVRAFEEGVLREG